MHYKHQNLSNLPIIYLLSKDTGCSHAGQILKGLDFPLEHSFFCYMGVRFFFLTRCSEIQKDDL